jgi:NADH:quinone reductase (non-electrogenic)
MLLTGTRNKIDAFMAWGWDYFSKDRATAMVDRPDATRIEWGMTTTGEQPQFEARSNRAQTP